MRNVLWIGTLRNFKTGVNQASLQQARRGDRASSNDMKIQTVVRLPQSDLRTGIAGALTCLLLAGAGAGVRSQETPPERAPEVRDKNVMKFKLYSAQGVLEAIATENYSLLATNAQKLGALTKQVSWRIRHTPEYERLTTDFRRQTDALAKAAKDKNVDAATVAYFQMTVSCVTCHKYLRGREVVLPP